jgi:hypothetical protein
VLFSITDGGVEEVLAAYAGQGIRMIPFGGRSIRATFHFQVDDAIFPRLLEVTDAVFSHR